MPVPQALPLRTDCLGFGPLLTVLYVDGAIRITRSGSPQLLSLNSASINSAEMSEGLILPRCAISARVLVRSTRVSRPSVEERRRTLSVETGSVYNEDGLLGGEYAE